MEIASMTFVDELRKKEFKEYEPPTPMLSKEEFEHKIRNEFILSGNFARHVIDKLKRNLLDELETSYVFGSPMERHHTVHCIYRESEYRKKECEYRTKYYCSEEQTTDTKERKQDCLKLHLLHCIFDKDEIDCLKQQLEKILISEGFNIIFDIKEFKYKMCSGFGLGVEEKSYGYTMSFTVYWR